MPGPLWDHLVERQFVADADINPADGFELLVSEARDMFRLASDLGAAPAVMVATASVVEPRDPSIRARLHALRVLHADFAAREDARVTRFREAVVPGAPIAEPEARELLASPLAARLHSSILDALGIPVVGHRATLAVDGSGRFRVDVRWGRRRKRLPWSMSGADEIVAVPYAFAGGSPVMIRAFEGSLLDELRLAAEAIAPTYLWHPAETAAFLLEGRQPSLIGATVELRQVFSAYPPRSTVVIRAEAWLPARVIAEAYRDIQRSVLPKGSRGAQARTAAAAAFIAEFKARTSRFTWAAAMDAWNEAQDREAMRWSNWRVFRRDCIRATRTLLFTPYRVPLAREVDTGSSPLRDQSAGEG